MKSLFAVFLAALLAVPAHAVVSQGDEVVAHGGGNGNGAGGNGSNGGPRRPGGHR